MGFGCGKGEFRCYSIEDTLGAYGKWGAFAFETYKLIPIAGDAASITSDLLTGDFLSIVSDVSLKPFSLFKNASEFKKQYRTIKYLENGIQIVKGADGYYRCLSRLLSHFTKGMGVRHLFF